MMRLVIDRQGTSGAGLNRYKGAGIYSAIGRKVLLSGLRNVTNAVEKANRSQLIADAVVNGRHRHEEAVKKASGSGKRKSSIPPEHPQQTAKAKKYSKSTVDKLINSSVVGGGGSGGSGIILD